MKQPKKLTRRQKELMSKKGFNAEEYSLIEESEHALIVKRKDTGTVLPVAK